MLRTTNAFALVYVFFDVAAHVWVVAWQTPGVSQAVN